MTTPLTPFDHRPDPVLGAALRDALQPGEGEAFRTRVLAAAQRAPVAVPVVDVLARWSRVGIAAAIVAALAAGVVVGRGARRAESAVTESDPNALIAGVQAPDANILLTGYPER
jgi:hypothetical protein